MFLRIKNRSNECCAEILRNAQKMIQESVFIINLYWQAFSKTKRIFKASDEDHRYCRLSDEAFKNMLFFKKKFESSNAQIQNYVER
jgi:hypothetical protein